MDAKKYFLLPKLLSDARHRCEMLQKSAAHAVDLKQSTLCAIEKGRRTPQSVSNEVLGRLATAYGLSKKETAELHFASGHDQLLVAAAKCGFESGAHVVSAALKVAQTLDPTESAGFVDWLEEISRNGRRVSDFAARVSGGTSVKEGPTI